MARFIHLTALRGLMDKRSMLANLKREFFVELKNIYANHYYDDPRQGVERRAALMRQQYQDHARHNDEHYYGVGGATTCATPFQNTPRRAE